MSPPRREPDRDFWRDQAPARRIDADGIRARSQRGAIGEQWWSRRFTGVLESLGMTGRMSRGRSYARSGQVLGFEITPGDVTALVQGSRPRPYKARMRVLPLTTAQWQRVTAALAARALFRASLLAGEMPAEIEEVFAACGTPLFPRTARDLDMSCSCPDWEVPCKHLAAVCYVLAEAFDDDPFAILAWRGRSRGDLLAAIRAAAPGGAGGAAVAASGAAGAVSGPGADGAAGHALAPPLISVADPPLAQVLDRFFEPGLSPARLAELPPAGLAPPDLLLRSLAPPAVTVRGRNLADLLGPAYQRLSGPDPAGPDPAIPDS